MKAIVQDTYGPAEVLSLADVDRPSPGPGEVLLRVRAAGVDPGVWHLMTGLPYLLRTFGYGLRAPKERVRGRDVAGVVEEVGPGATRFRVGDEVFGTCEGSFAEYARARVDRLAAKPSTLDFVHAAAVPISGLTALQGLRDNGLAADSRVLVIGAGGGVGVFAVQIARAAGAHVTGVCGPGKLDLVRSLGAHEVIDYTTDDCGGGTYDLVLDTAGGRSLSRLRKLLTAKGTLVIVGAETGGRLLGGTDRVLRALLLSPFVGHRLRGLVSTEHADDLEVLRGLAEDGVLAPVVDRVFPLPAAPDAIRYTRGGHARGKVVVTV